MQQRDLDLRGCPVGNDGEIDARQSNLERNVEIAMENYRKTVDHLAKLAEQRR